MNNETIENSLLNFKKKYPWTLAWRLKAHARIATIHLNPNETILFAFAAQQSQYYINLFNTHAIVLTNERIMITQKRLLFGYSFKAITPDMFNDLTVSMGALWGSVTIDTVKEVVTLSFIQKEALPEIETAITTYMMKEKQKYTSQAEA